MKLTELKELNELADLVSDFSEVIDQMYNGDSDFEVEGYRFIDPDYIDKIMVQELEQDEYLLGCFNSEFLSNLLDIDTRVIDSMQDVGAYEAIGKLVLSMDKLEELQKAYVAGDGYGHHFAHYDHETIELSCGYYAFRVN
jgi:hypothetical protein